MAISYIGIVGNGAQDGGDVALDLTTIGTLLEDDLVVVVYGIGDDDDVDFDMAIVSPSGFTEVADLFSDDTFDSHLGAFYKVMGATPDTTVTVDGLGGADAAVAAIAWGFRGVDTTTPMDVAATTNTEINTMDATPPSINYLDAGAAIFIAAVAGHSDGNQVATMPTGYTGGGQTTQDFVNDVTVSGGYDLTPAGDPETPGQITHDGTDSTSFSCCSVTMALRPAGAAAGGLTAGSLSLMGVGI